jgi:hypothetical protein
MSLQTLKSVKLIHSKVIKKGISNKNVGVLSDELKKQQRKGKEYRFLDEGRIKNNEVLEKTIHAYRMWFLFLKLGLELEEQNATIILKQDRYTIINRWLASQKRVKIADRVTKKVKVKRSKYMGWDLDEVLTKSFDEWWKTHSHLFSEELCKVLEENDTISADKKHITVQIDTTLKLTDILKVVTSIIKDRRKSNKNEILTKKKTFSITGNIHKDALLSKYNALLLRLEDNLSNQEILTHKDGYIRFDYSTTFNKNGNEDFTKPMHSLLNGSTTTLGAKGILLEVCEGRFLGSAA